MIALVIGAATPVTLLRPTPAHAQTCSVNKAGSCQAYQVAAVSLTTTTGTAVTTTDPSEAKTGGGSQSVCDITAPYPVYCGDGVLTPPSNGTATDDLGSGGLITYTPNPGFVGTDTFVTQTGLLTDGLTRAWVVTTTYTVTVSGPVAPTVSNTTLSTAYNTTGAVTLPSSGAVSGFSIVGGPVHGAATISGSTAVYTPNAGYVGSDSFTFSATGAGGTSNTATVSVTVGAPPAPTASNGALSTAYNTAASTTLTGSGVISSYAIVAGPNHGSVTLSGALATYAPTPGYAGSDSFTFDVTGPGGTSSPATISVTVSPPAPPPPEVNNATITTAYNTPGSVVLVTGGVITSFTIPSGPSHGAAIISGSTAVYTPNAGYFGSDSFTVSAKGPTGASNTATVSVTVSPPPAPTTTAGAMTTAYNTAGSTTLSGSGLISGYAIVSSPAHGTVSLSGSTAVYTPSPGYAGSDSFTFDVSGPGGTSSAATISVTVQAPAAPTVNGALISTPYNTPGSAALTSTGLVTSFTIASRPAHGAATLSGSTAIYTPNAGYVGSDSFTVYATGPGGQSSAASVSVNVAPPPTPVASNGSLSTTYNTAGSTSLAASGAISSYAIVTGPSHGTVTISGSLATYTPSSGFNGSDSFTFAASGPGGTSSPATISVTVGLPPAPMAASGTITTAYETPATATLPGSGVISGYAIVSGPARGSITLSSASVTYTPAAGFSGADSFTYDVTGPGGTSATATVSVTVDPPAAPTASNGTIATAYNTAASTTLSGSGVIASYAIVSGPSHGTVSLAGATATYTPAAGFIGSDSFTFHIVGPGGTSATATISVTVQAPPAPTASNGTISTVYDTPGSTTLTASGAVSSFAVVSGPTNGSVTLSGAVATYAPNPGFIGADSFTFQVTGPGGVSAPATISVTVAPPPAPVANSGSITCPYQTTCETTLTSTGLGSTYTLATQASIGACSISGSTLTYTPIWGAVGSDSCTFTVTGPGGTSAPATIYITIEPPPLPEGPGSPTSGPGPSPSSGTSTAICLAGMAATIPDLPGPPTGTVFDPNWCNEQVLTITEQALQLQNQQSQVAALQSQLAVQQKMVQGLGSDSTSATLATVNAQAAKILQQATGIGFSSQSAGTAFAAAYPGGETVAGFNGSQLTTALQAWQTNTAQALQTSIAVQNQIAQSQAGVTGAVQNAVNASIVAPGQTAAHQATNQILAAVSAQLAQLQDILLAESQAYAVLAAAKSQAAATAAASAGQTLSQVRTTLTPPSGVTDTTRM